MKPRIELNPDVIRHIRLRRGWSMKDAADCLRKRENQNQESLTNMYQRIEATGITSPSTGEKIAKHFGVTIETLLGEVSEHDDPSQWWLESSNLFIGGKLLCSGMQLNNTLREEIKQCLSGPQAKRIDAHITRNKYECTFEIVRSGWPSKLKWKIHAAEKTERGLSWKTFTAWEHKYIEDTLSNIGYQVGDYIHVNGNQTPPEDASLELKLTCIDLDKTIEIESRIISNYYSNSVKLIEDLVAHFESLNTQRFYLNNDDYAVSVCSLDDHFFFDISQSWFNPLTGDYKKAPFREAHIHSLAKEIREYLDKRFTEAIWHVHDLGGKHTKFIPEDSTKVLTTN